MYCILFMFVICIVLFYRAVPDDLEIKLTTTQLCVLHFNECHKRYTMNPQEMEGWMVTVLLETPGVWVWVVCDRGWVEVEGVGGSVGGDGCGWGGGGDGGWGVGWGVGWWGWGWGWGWGGRWGWGAAVLFDHVCGNEMKISMKYIRRCKS